VQKILSTPLRAHKASPTRGQSNRSSPWLSKFRLLNACQTHSPRKSSSSWKIIIGLTALVQKILSTQLQAHKALPTRGQSNRSSPWLSKFRLLNACQTHSPRKSSSSWKIIIGLTLVLRDPTKTLIPTPALSQQNLGPFASLRTLRYPTKTFIPPLPCRNKIRDRSRACAR